MRYNNLINVTRSVRHRLVNPSRSQNSLNSTRKLTTRFRTRNSNRYNSHILNHHMATPTLMRRIPHNQPRRSSRSPTQNDRPKRRYPSSTRKPRRIRIMNPLPAPRINLHGKHDIVNTSHINRRRNRINTVRIINRYHRTHVIDSIRQPHNSNIITDHRFIRSVRSTHYNGSHRSNLNRNRNNHHASPTANTHSSDNTPVTRQIDLTNTNNTNANLNRNRNLKNVRT